MKSKQKGNDPAGLDRSSHDLSRSHAEALTRKHLQWGWWGLLIFLSLGIVLEALHGFKVGAYLNVGNETRRLMWRLAHAHGTMLSLMHMAFALTIPHLDKLADKQGRQLSRCMMGASILMPAGFFLGGVVTYGGDPGLGIFLLPIGAFLLFVGVYGIASALGKKG
jgi:hypothetical protein